MFRYWLRHVLVEISDSNQFQQRRASESIVFGKRVTETKPYNSHKKEKNIKVCHEAPIIPQYLSKQYATAQIEYMFDTEIG